MSNMAGQPMPITFKDVLTLTNNYQGLGAALTQVQDAAGNNSPMQIALQAVNFQRTNGNTFQLDGIALTASATALNNVSSGVIPGNLVQLMLANFPYNVANGDYIVALNQAFAMDGNVNVILPNAATQPVGRVVSIKDQSGSLTGARTITVSAAVGTIDGMIDNELSSPYSAITVYSNGVEWFTLNTN